DCVAICIWTPLALGVRLVLATAMDDCHDGALWRAGNRTRVSEEYRLTDIEICQSTLQMWRTLNGGSHDHTHAWQDRPHGFRPWSRLYGDVAGFLWSGRRDGEHRHHPRRAR